jgi:5,10-methylenetetrahydromethanopterin reductase
VRIGISLADPRPGPDPFGELLANLERAADDGFASAWMSNVFGLDALTALAVVGSRVPGIELGTAVVPTYPRHPGALAQQALTTQAAVGGRLTLGIGVSHRMVVEGMFGYSFERPVQHMREYLRVLLPLLEEGTVSFAGETVRATLSLATPRVHPIPVLLAALGPRMLRLAGEMAGGTVLWMTGPATVASHVVPVMTAAARDAGRPAPRVVCFLPVSVTADPDAARHRADRVFAVYGQLPSYRAMLDREGAEGPGDVAVVGDEETVAARLDQLAEAGVTDFVATEFARGEDAARTRALLRDLAAGGP